MYKKITVKFLTLILTLALPISSTSIASATNNISHPEIDAVQNDKFNTYQHLETQASVVKVINDGDIVYYITRFPNKLVVYDSFSEEFVNEVQLPGIPAEIHIENNQILISFPNLKTIKYYNKDSFDYEKELKLPQIVSSFCFYNEYIFYSEDDQHCKVFRTNMNTGETKQVMFSCYFPKLLVNTEDKLLYIGESHSTGSKLYYVDLESLTVKSSFALKNYGYCNCSRNICYDGEYVYFGRFRVDKLNANKVVGEYDDSYRDGVGFVSGEFVTTRFGVYVKDTYEPILYFDNAEEHSLITSSENLCVISKTKWFFSAREILNIESQFTFL